MSYYFDPINILDTSNSLGLGSGGSMTISGGISVGRDTFIGGNLAISGTATSFSDNILLINHNPNVSSDTGLLFQRYNSDITNNQNYCSIIYKESDDEFVFGYIENDIQKELNSFSGYTALKANSLTLVSTNNSSFNETGSLNVLGGIKINKDAYLLGKMYITDSIVFNTTGNNQSNIELESTQSLYIGSNKAHVQINGNDVLNNPGHIEMAFNTYMSFNYKSNGQNQNEVLRISTSGNIGIGNTSPNYKLHVEGDINFTGNMYKDGNVFSGSSQWETIDSNIVYTSGNIGINTTAPNSNLEVNGSLFALSGSISQLQVTNVSSGVLLSNTSIVALGNSNTLGSLITTGGNVGIGVVPNTKGQLHISSSTSTNLIISGATYDPSGAIGILFQSDDIGSLNNVARYKTKILAVGDGYYGQSDLHFVLNNDYDVNDATLADTRMIIKKDGNVGIGTVEPNAKLTVFNATNTDTGMSIIAGGENNNVSLFFGTPFQGDLNNALKTAIIAQGNGGWSRNDLHFCLNDNGNSNDNFQNASLQHAKLTIKNSGNVGVGTTDPTRKFHIEGPSASMSGPHILITNTENPYPLFQLNNWSNDNIALNFDMYWDGSIQRSSSSTGSFQIAKVASQLQFNVANANPGDTISTSTAICIGSTGNIGIGSNSPIAKIDIIGGSQNTGASGSPLLAFQYFDGGYRHFIKSRHNSVTTFDNGNAIDIYLNKSVNAGDSSTPGTGNSLAISITGAGVGIGTSTPTSNLVVFANGISIFDPLTPTIAEFRGSATSSTPETILRLGRGHSSGIAHAASAEFQVYRAYTTDVSANSGLNIKLGSLTNDNADKSIMTLVANGNVGIGTTVPSTNLDVNGSFNCLSATVGTLLANTSFSAVGNSNTLGNLFTTTNGNIGIGTTDPSSLLHVNGEIFCNSLVSPSDERLKKDIALVETENCYNLVKNIPLKQYRWNTEMHNIHVPRNDTRLGWIAQDLEESFPQSVEYFSAYGIRDCRTINMDQLIAVMYGTIQELQKKVEQLEQDNSNYYLNGR